MRTLCTRTSLFFFARTGTRYYLYIPISERHRERTLAPSVAIVTKCAASSAAARLVQVKGVQLTCGKESRRYIRVAVARSRQHREDGRWKFRLAWNVGFFGRGGRYRFLKQGIDDVPPPGVTVTIASRRGAATSPFASPPQTRVIIRTRLC